MSLPEGKAIYLIAFSSPLVLYMQTHRPACHPYSLLFIDVNFLCWHLFFSSIYLYLCPVFKNNVQFKLLFLWKSIICAPFNQKRILIRMKLFLFSLMKFLRLFLRIFVLIVCLSFLIVQPLKRFLMKSETKSKIWSAIIAAAVSLLTSIAQIFS
jgi:hypothetical protein